MENLSNDVVIHKNNNGIEYIQFKRLLEYPEIEHCYTMRSSDMDFRIYGDDNILQNSYDKICRIIDFNRASIVKPHQTHTDRIEVVQNAKEAFNEVDGLITDKEKITLCTTSADCTSLLLYDPVKHVIGDVHSGWRGTVQKIGQKAVKKMIEEYDCKPKNIICAICPHIRKCHFEVGEDVEKIFRTEFEYTGKLNEFIVESQKVNGVQKYHIDTTLINKIILEEAGLLRKNILDSDICTVCNKDLFHSYRAEKELSGRNGAIISLNHLL